MIYILAPLTVIAHVWGEPLAKDPVVSVEKKRALAAKFLALFNAFHLARTCSRCRTRRENPLAL
jgi:hypothetical protein